MLYDYMKGLHREKFLENLRQLLGKNTPSRTQVFFSGLVNLVEAAIIIPRSEETTEGYPV